MIQYIVAHLLLLGILGYGVFILRKWRNEKDSGGYNQEQPRNHHQQIPQQPPQEAEEAGAETTGYEAGAYKLKKIGKKKAEKLERKQQMRDYRNHLQREREKKEKELNEIYIEERKQRKKEKRLELIELEKERQERDMRREAEERAERLQHEREKDLQLLRAKQCEIISEIIRETRFGPLETLADSIEEGEAAVKELIQLQNEVGQLDCLCDDLNYYLIDQYLLDELNRFIVVKGKVSYEDFLVHLKQQFPVNKSF